jgi:magnesium chelatase subunit ChlD-like protein
MGRHARTTRSHRAAARCAELAKKNLTIRPTKALGADGARPKGKPAQGNRGRPQSGRGERIAWVTTLRHGRPQRQADLHWQQRHGKAGELWLIIVDASASTRRHGALSHAKGLLASVFDDAYRQRARLALLTASGAHPQWQRQGLKASAALQPWLAQLGAGGGTPLLQAVQQARHWLQRRQLSHPEELQRCLVITDGRLKQWPVQEPLPCQTCVMDIERGAIRLGRAQRLAEQLGGDYRHIDAQFDKP